MIGNHAHLYRHNRRLVTSVAAKYHRALNVLFCRMSETLMVNTVSSPETIYQLCVPLDTEANSLLDVSQNENDPTAVDGGGLTFTADVGFTGFTASDYIDTGISEVSVGDVLQLEHFIGVYITGHPNPEPTGYSYNPIGCRDNTATSFYSYINLLGFQLAAQPPSQWTRHYSELTDRLTYTHINFATNVPLGFFGYFRDFFKIYSCAGTGYAGPISTVINSADPDKSSQTYFVGAYNNNGVPVNAATGAEIAGWIIGRRAKATGSYTSAQVYECGNVIKDYLDML